MKRTKFLTVLVAMIVAITALVGLCACKRGYTVTVDTSKSTIIRVGDEIDYTEYFNVTDKNGYPVKVTESMLDLSNADTSMPGSFTVTINVGGTSEKLTFIVVSGTSGDNNHGTDKPDDSTNDPDDNTDKPDSSTNNNTNANSTASDAAPLQSEMKKVEGAIGLPSQGDYHALVIPVQFKNDTITTTQLNKLNTAFNGTSEETGWESVRTYYQKASYGKLNLSFDIAGVNLTGVDYYKANNTASYYENYKQNYTQDGETYTRTGEEVILKEVLSYYESRLDLTNYDTNGDDTIDAVYLIYSAPVDYDNAEFYWAYVTWFYGEETYDKKDAFYYLFAGFDFMDEDLDSFDGMKVNAETYIHETGHLLGLDDYYDYYTDEGCNEGLGGADMMDYNKGDHGVYSKIMLGWLEPTVVTATKTVTIKSSCTQGDAILVPLNYDNTYFSEYLLIDLYAAQGLNEMAAKMDNSILYGGADYGVRIYHVSSSAKDPYNNDYGSFTDYNNSVSDIALIKLIEADGETKFASSQGEAASTDLWRAGQSLNSVFPDYTTNDSKSLKFNITIVSVSADSATITITYN